MSTLLLHEHSIPNPKNIKVQRSASHFIPQIKEKNLQNPKLKTSPLHSSFYKQYNNLLPYPPQLSPQHLNTFLHKHYHHQSLTPNPKNPKTSKFITRIIILSHNPSSFSLKKKNRIFNAQNSKPLLFIQAPTNNIIISYHIITTTSSTL